MEKTVIAFKNETPLPGGDFIVVLAEAPQGQEVKRQHWVSRRQFKRKGNAKRYYLKLLRKIATEDVLRKLEDLGS